MKPASSHRTAAHLFESVHPTAAAALRAAGWSVKASAGAPSAAELARILAGVDVIGIRSRTHVSARELSAARRLLAIGCFAVGTNNVDVSAAALAGIPVFNAPHASTRSVAELTVGFLVLLARRVAEKSLLARQGRWAKDAEGSHELRGRTLGIVGYGHVGAQVSVLAEALGMRILFHDIVDRQPLGNAQPVASLDALLPECHFLTLHVPGGAGTRHLVSRRQLALLRKGACLVNTSRGSVVDEKALLAALTSGRLAGAALDVLENEPTSPGAPVHSPLLELPGVLVTPHVGGSTAEAQLRIGDTVAAKLARYVDDGTTTGAVGFPQLELPRTPGTHRLAHVHRNVPGVLSGVNGILSRLGANVEAQFLKTEGDVGYLVIDVDRTVSLAAVRALSALPETIRARRLS